MSSATGGDRSAEITVAVATCGRPEALARCLAALAQATLRPREIIVVDQAPSDEARDAVEACRQPGARYLEQPRLGLSASRNLALGAAAMPLLAVTDDDCAPERGWVAAIVSAFERAPRPDAVTGPIVPLGPRPPGAHAISLRSSIEARDFRGRPLPWDVGSGANFAGPRSVLLAHGGWDERLGVGSAGQAAEDADLIYRILLGGGLVRYDPAAVVGHEWQSRARRLQTRSAYAYGVGALCGLWLRRGDAFALRMLLAYARLHGRRLAWSAGQRDCGRAQEHARALRGVLPGVVYGVRAARRPARARPPHSVPPADPGS